MKTNKIAVLIILILLGSFIYANVRNIRMENHPLEDGLDAVEDAISKGKDSNSKNDSQSISEANTDMQEGTSDNIIGTPDDFPKEIFQLLFTYMVQRTHSILNLKNNTTCLKIWESKPKELFLMDDLTDLVQMEAG